MSASWAACLGAVLALAACQSAPPSTAPSRSVPHPERPFLFDPARTLATGDRADGQGTGVTTDERVRFAQRAHERLLDRTDPRAVATEMASALAGNPGFAAFEVVLAQAEFLDEVSRWSEGVDEPLSPPDGLALERFGAAQAVLEPLVERRPDYRPAVILAARVAELQGRVVAAYSLYRRVGEAAGLGSGERVALERAGALESRVESRLVDEAEDAFERLRLEEAAARVADLERWFPSARATLDLRRRYALEIDDPAMELTAVRRLVALDPSLRPRLGELELEAGDLRSGLELLQALVREQPDDMAILGLLDRARFLWSLETVPERVRTLARAPELDRAGLASLVHWLVPPVRFWQIRQPPIASDLVDRPERAEILKVLDLGLLSSDTNVHRFYPERPATRRETLDAALGVVAMAEPPAACLGGAPPPRPTRTWTCDAAARCGLLDDAGECLSGAVISGTAATEIFRRALIRLDG